MKHIDCIFYDGDSERVRPSCFVCNLMTERSDLVTANREEYEFDWKTERMLDCVIEEKRREKREAQNKTAAAMTGAEQPSGLAGA